ncbi:leucine-rich repeat domain-containing protein, partial [Polaribacter haliotis]
MKTKLLLILTLLSLTIYSQTSVPDDAFETYLETHDASGNVVTVGDANSLGDGTDGNNLVTTSKIDTLKTLSLSFLGIEKLDGIEDFAALESFTFDGNNVALTDVDLSENLNLKSIIIRSFPNLTNLNITGLTSLEDLTLRGSTIITFLDFTALLGLKKIHIGDFSSLTSFNISNLTSLEEFIFQKSNAMNSLDLSTLTGLKRVYISNNTLLSSVTLKTGTTANIDIVQLLGNTMLTCVEVDAGIPINGLTTWYQQHGPIFNEDCANPATYIPDDNFEAYLEANSMGNGIANDDLVTTSNINTITALDVSNQSISDLTGIEDFIALTELKANTNTISTVNLTENISLEKIYLNNNTLTEINVSKNIGLKQLWVRSNTIKNLDVSSNVALEWLVCSRNNIENLDLSVNTAAGFLELHTNNLKTLNLKNISNTTISYFDAKLNPNLSCIQVDDSAYWTTNFATQIDATSSFSVNCNYPTTNVLDAAFENYLETHDRNGNVVALGHINSMGNAIANDGKVFTHRIETVIKLDIQSPNTIADFTGLKDFRDLEIFGYLFGNVFSTIDFSSNLKMKRITLGLNAALTNVTFGNLPDVEYIQLGSDLVANVDLSGLPKLEEFKSLNGKLTSLNTAANSNLKRLTLANNLITSLDLSTNILLERLNATNNKLTSLNLKNNANNLIQTGFFNIRNNPGLTCIEVSDVAYANANWTAKDTQHSFNTDCSAVWSVMTSSATTTVLLTITGLDANNDGAITVAEAAAFTGDANGELNLSGTGITDVEGLQAFTSILQLDVSGNGITDLSPLTNSTFGLIAKSTGKTKTIRKTTAMALETIVLNDNSFEVLDFNTLTNLKNVDISNNPN